MEVILTPARQHPSDKFLQTKKHLIPKEAIPHHKSSFQMICLHWPPCFLGTSKVQIVQNQGEYPSIAEEFLENRREGLEVVQAIWIAGQLSSEETAWSSIWNISGKLQPETWIHAIPEAFWEYWAWLPAPCSKYVRDGRRYYGYSSARQAMSPRLALKCRTAWL